MSVNIHDMPIISSKLIQGYTSKVQLQGAVVSAIKILHH